MALIAALALSTSRSFGEPIPKVRTYADMIAEITRHAGIYNEGLLNSKDCGFDDAEFIASLFYELPLSERATYIIARFADTDLDGEKAYIMFILLTRRNYSHVVGPSQTKSDRTYTRAVFKIIHSYKEEQLKAFCEREGDYGRFRKNLKSWEKDCARDE